MLLVQFADTRGAGNVDLSNEFADHIQADEQHAGGAQLGAYLRT